MWLSHLFTTLLHMSLTASIAILVVCVLRLLLKRAPKVFSYALWLIVLFRLLCPISIETAASILPTSFPHTFARIQAVATNLFSEETTPAETSPVEVPPAETVPPKAALTETEPSETIPPQTGSILAASAAADNAAKRDHLAMIAGPVWLAGVGAMALYYLVSLVRLRRRLVGAVRLRDHLYLADHIPTAFVLGAIRPKIYLPSTLSEGERDLILLHEQVHIRRGDHLFKLIGVFALSLHWFNPLVWLAFRLAVNDMELSCDEAVLKRMDQSRRPDYSVALLTLSTGRRIVLGAPLAFGEGDVKQRIKHIIRYRNPTTVVLALAVVCCLTSTACLATDPLPYGFRGDSTDPALLVSEPVSPSLDSAISTALLDILSGTDHFAECFGEGHLVLDYQQQGKRVTVYVLAISADYQFIDDMLISAGGCGVLPMVLLFQETDGGYTLLDWEMTGDFEEEPYIETLFPQSLWERCYKSEDNSYVYEALQPQQDKYAEEYLATTGRKAKVGDYEDLNWPLLSDFGVSVEVDNKLTESDLLSSYPSGIGKQEQVEDGVRYVYRKAYDEQKRLISFTKSNYATGELVERFCFDATDGTLIQSLSTPKAGTT